MNFLKYGGALFITLGLMLGAAFLNPAMGQNNRFLVTEDFKISYYNPNTCFGSNSPTLMVSFYVRNVSNGGIKVFFTGRQARALQVNHITSTGCSGDLNISGIPIIYFDGQFDEARAERTAVYIPKGDGVYVTSKMTWCDCSKVRTGEVRGGVVSGNVTVIKGRRILTRPINGRF